MDKINRLKTNRPCSVCCDLTNKEHFALKQYAIDNNTSITKVIRYCLREIIDERESKELDVTKIRSIVAEVRETETK